MSLQNIAACLSKLKANTAQKAGLLTYPIGALYSAYEAKKCGYTDRTAHPNRWLNELQDALCVAQDIATSRTPSKPSWTSIVHFNSALLRIDVGFERLLRHVTRSKSRNIETLVRLAKKRGISQGSLKRWRDVRDQEVNALKHRNPSVLTKDRMKFREMLAALDDLSKLLEKKL